MEFPIESDESRNNTRCFQTYVATTTLQDIVPCVEIK